MRKAYVDILHDHFPHALPVSGGLNNGKHETDHYLFHLECGFYTRKADGKTFFVERNYGRMDWAPVLEKLKTIITNPIGKGVSVGCWPL